LRVKHRAALCALIAERLTAFHRDALLESLEQVGVPAGPINSVADVFDDRQVQARGMKVELASGDAVHGTIPTVRTPIVINGQAMVAERPSPRLGADTAAVLNDIAWGGRGSEER
jgi:crotonobetainyl-CoA:carnitine CoA-transferase CaiB-like acyl-CoA transferase